MNGGLDIQTPPFQLRPGFCRAAQNFEQSIYGGYRRVAGYERTDGRAKPSDATYTIVNTGIISGGAIGNTLTGATSGATGKIVAIVTQIVAPATSFYFVVTATSGAYQAGENLNVGAGTIAVCSAPGIIGGAPTPKLNAQYKNLAADVYRALIGAVPGAGRVLGVVFYNDVLYAFRNNAGNTASVMYKQTAGGWSLVALGRSITFSTGSAALAEGVTITGATSGATGVLKRQVLETGNYVGSTATGKLIFTTVTGLFQNGENLQVAGVTKAVAVGADAAITLLPGGRYEFVIESFTGSADATRVYGCDGVNKAFEFDGTVYVPITTGMPTDAPTHIEVHLFHLFLSFFGSAQFSAAGLPYQWTAIVGAGEIAMGANITGFAVLQAGTVAASLAIFTEGRLSILYGTGSADWTLLPFRDKVGSYPFSLQNLNEPMFLDTQGISNLTQTQQFGNFSFAALSNAVRSLIAGWRNAVIASSLNRDLAQYRLFFTNNYALYVTVVGKKVSGIMPVLYAHTVRCTCNGKTSSKEEVSYFGGDNGFVYQMDKGTSFDGSDIEAYINLAYNFSRGARTLKRYRHAALEIQGSAYGEINFGYALGYGLPSAIQPMDQQVFTNFASVNWDAFTWDAFTWDGSTIGPSSIDLDGEAENISFAIKANGDYFEPFTVSGGFMHYTPRRQMR